jgi:hypothetical protein
LFLEGIERKISILEDFKQKKERQQISYPLEQSSLPIIHEDVVIQQGQIVVPFNLVSYTEPFQVRINNEEFNIASTPII